MEGEAIIRGGSEEWWYRVLGQGHERGSFWAVHPLDNRLTYHAGVGANPLIELVRPGPSYSDQMLAQRQSLWPPSHYVTGVLQPRQGELWSTTWVSSIEAAHVRDFDAQESLPRLVHEAFDTRIEVADPSTGRIVGSLTVDRALAPSATEALLFAVVETPDGNLLVEIWSARLE